MENILTKALKEVLTPRYSEELRDAFETGYKFSDRFEQKMRELIRKTDRPIYKYTGVLAAAACAVIAIGCAVLIPLLNNNDINVVPDSTGTNAAATSAPDVVTDTSVTPEFSQTSPTSESVPDVSSAAPDSDITSETTVTDAPDTTTSQTSPTPGIPSVEVGTKDSTDGGEAEIVSGDDDLDADDDDISIDDGDNDYPDGDDDACIVDDSDSEDDIVVIADDDTDWDDRTVTNVRVTEGTTLEDTFTDMLGDNFKGFDELYAYNGIYTADAHTGARAGLPFRNTELGFIQDFVHELGAAKAVSMSEEDEDCPILKLEISTSVAMTKVRDFNAYYNNNSYWLDYEKYFGNGNGSSDDVTIDEDVVDDDMDDEDVPVGQLYIQFEAVIYGGTGCVSVSNIIVNEGSESKYYKFENDYKFDAGKVDALFAKIDKLFIPDTVRTVGDISKALGLDATGIAAGSVTVQNVYDTILHSAKVEPEYITGLLKKYSGSRLEVSSTMPALDLHYSIAFKNGVFLNMGFAPDGKFYINGGNRRYCFAVDDTELESALASIGKANGITIPIFRTLGEYLESKNFKELRQIWYFDSVEGATATCRLEDSKDLAELYKMLKVELATAKYVHGDKAISGAKGIPNIHIFVRGYNVALCISGDYLWVEGAGRCKFKLSDGFAKKFYEYLKTTKYTFEKLDDETTPVDDESDDPVDD